MELINRHREAHLDWGFFTLAFSEIQTEVQPRNIAKKYPTKVPVAKLARFAVSKNINVKVLEKYDGQCSLKSIDHL